MSLRTVNRSGIGNFFRRRSGKPASFGEPGAPSPRLSASTQPGRRKWSASGLRDALKDFTRLGQADSDFSLAFANYDARPSQIPGPFKGTVTLQAGATNDEAPVAEYQLFVDGRTYDEPIRFLPATTWEFTTVLNVQELTPGLHYLCARITNTLGHQQLSEAVLFRVDPNAATAAALWRLPILRFAGKVSLR